ncbi:hypothetical protein D3C85_1261860 [compost metagenome]
MLFQGVFDGQFVQAELLLQNGQLFGAGLLKADPDEMPGLAGPQTAFVEADIGNSFTGVIYRGSNDSTHGCSLLVQLAVKATCTPSLVCQPTVGKWQVRRPQLTPIAVRAPCSGCSAAFAHDTAPSRPACPVARGLR